MQHDQLGDQLVEPAIRLVENWLRRSNEIETTSERATMEQLGSLVGDATGVKFVMQFVDRVTRADGHATAAVQMAALVESSPLPAFLSPIDRAMLKVGARLAPKLPKIVMPIAKRRMRSIVGHLVAPGERAALVRHLDAQRSTGYAVNVNLLGEAVLGEREADARLERLVELVRTPAVDYVSVKPTAIASQLNHWAFDASLERVAQRLALLVDAASTACPPAFVNFDMEEYADLHLTLAAFKAVLGDPERFSIDCGIVLQAYLPDVFPLLRDLVDWANERHASGGGTIKIRIVKGANLAMEQVDAAMHGWPQAPFASKLESDASFRMCFDWLLVPERLAGVRVGVASHNLFDVAWIKLLAEARGVADRLQFEMLQGMAPGQARAVSESTADVTEEPMLLYTPAVDDADFDVAIGYLFRRLEENAAPSNFMRKLFDLTPASPEFDAEAEFFRRGVQLRTQLDHSPRRNQDRGRSSALCSTAEGAFSNEPDTDPSLPANLRWIKHVAAGTPSPCVSAVIETRQGIAEVVDRARHAAPGWEATPVEQRRELLHLAADQLAMRRGELISTMMQEASKTFMQADNEVSEAVDFARWYGDRCVELTGIEGAQFSPLGVVAVIPPWNFPAAIPAGGIVSALAAGNTVICKPAPETPRCAEVIVEACWAAGISRDVLQLVRTPDNEVGQDLVESVDAVILTGSSETADLFQSWKPDLRLFAETSGKNVLIITPSADVDLAVNDLVQSAFGHAGQKCSAASVAILVGDVATSESFRRQLVDAVTSLTLGPATDLATDVAPMVGGINSRLRRAITALDAGESWLVRPVDHGNGVLSPGVRDGVRPGSWFHRTECFGPVLGLMTTQTLDAAIDMANTSDFGLTGGIHSLDPSEVARWLDRIEVGNCYVNRPITGAIVQRQPFGGWKRSSVGPGAKAGGPNYLLQLGSWHGVVGHADDYDEMWSTHFARSHDATGLFCEANVLRYRPIGAIGMYLTAEASAAEVARVEKAAGLAGVRIMVSEADDIAWFDVLVESQVNRVRVVGGAATTELARAANQRGIHLIEGPVTASGRIELLNYVREQSVSVTLHRFGNLVTADQLVAAI